MIYLSGCVCLFLSHCYNIIYESKLCNYYPTMYKTPHKHAILIVPVMRLPFKLPAALHPSLLLQVQYSMKILYVPVRIRQNRSSPCIPGSPKYAQLRKYRHSPFTAR